MELLRQRLNKGVTVENIRQALYAATGKGARKLLKEQATIYEKITLSNEIIPDECIDLIVEILSTDELFSKPGIDVFFLKASTDMYRLSEIHKQRLLVTICENYSKYTNIEMCWQLGDMIARAYEPATAIKVFQRLFASATDQGKEGIVLGLDIIARQSKRDTKIMREIDAIIKPDTSSPKS
ncbi:hypothetical protein [Ralstonia solanacearum]|uniref:hypothetical protein n=1 Tax=Ralstonia solanacearum TaxID=305 RepID=UPI001E3D8A87|nr:hypothetical protein [Ralstonia solanacearum]